ncbi:MAG: hypothetical protein Q9162_000006 [Coniocarpon cinnabarinum]
MALLHNEDFIIYQLRTSYLTHIQDGIGERLINVDASVLNDPAFRAAGWVPDTAAIKRTYSPPIPTSSASDYFQAPPNSAGLPGTPGLGEEDDDGTGVASGPGTKDSNDTVGPAPIGGRKNRRRKEQLREKEDDSSDLSDETDDEDAESMAASQRPTHQIRFAKMPVRGRADSSPPRARQRAASSPERAGSEGEQRDGGPSVMVTSPSRPPERNWSKRENWGAAQSMRPTRPRRDTTTSSEVSSEGDSLDPSVFKKSSIRRPGARRPAHKLSDERIAEEVHEGLEDSTRPSTAASEDAHKSEMSGPSQEGPSDDDDVSDDVSLASSGFSDEENSLLEGMAPIGTSPLGPALAKSPLKQTPSPRKNKSNSNPDRPELQELPPPRPISTVQPVSALAAQLKAQNRKPGNIFERFAPVDGTDASDPLHIKIYVPSSTNSDEAMELEIRRTLNNGEPVPVGDAIGFALLKYGEHDLQPKIQGLKANVNKWTFRIMDDGEVDDDFPPLGRTKALVAFANNNTRPARGRARGKPWDEFGLVEATAEQFRENERETPGYTQEAKAAQASTPSAEPALPTRSTEAFEPFASPANTATAASSVVTAQQTSRPPSYSNPSAQVRPSGPVRQPSNSDPPPPRSSSFAASAAMTGRPPNSRQATNPMPVSNRPIGPLPFVRTKTTTPMDMPTMPAAPTMAERSGAPRTLNVHFTTPDVQTMTITLDVTTDTYISEVFDTATSRLQLDKGNYVLRVTGTSTVAPSDRTVEALGPERRDLDLTRRRFISEGPIGLAGSPGSTSPNAPLLLTTTGTPTKGTKTRHHKRKDGDTGFAGGFAAGFHGFTTTHPLATTSDLLGPAAMANSSYRRWNVTRRQPMSFTASAPRVLAVDAENLYISPPEGKRYGGNTTAAGADDKTRIVAFGAVTGVKVLRKHPRSFRIVVFREVGKEQKRYDFEAGSSEEAREIVGFVERGVEGARLRGWGREG